MQGQEQQTTGMRADHATHPNHVHVHAPGCGHEVRRHEKHDDYEHDGHWHAKHGDHYDEHA